MALASASVACSGDDADDTADPGTETATGSPAAATTAVTGVTDATDPPPPKLAYWSASEIIAAQDVATDAGTLPLANTWTDVGGFSAPGKTQGGRNILILDGFEDGDTLLSPVAGVIKEASTAQSDKYSLFVIVVESGGRQVGFQMPEDTRSPLIAGLGIQLGAPFAHLSGAKIPEEDNLSRPAQVAIFDVSGSGLAVPPILTTEDGSQVALRP